MPRGCAARSPKWGLLNREAPRSALDESSLLAGAPQMDNLSGEQIVYSYDALNRLASALAGGNTSSTIPTVGYWRLDEAAGATSFADSSGNGNTRTCSGANCPTMGVAGKVGTAGSFNGSSSVINLGAGSVLRPAGAVSVAAWIKAGATQTSYPQIMSSADSTGVTGYNLYLQNGSGQGAAAFIVKESSSAWGNCYAQGTTNLKDDAWHQVAGVYSGTDIKIYVDGSLQTSGKCQSTAIDYGTSPQAEIGKKADAGTNDYFTGSIDEVRVYNQALSAADVNTLAAITWGQTYTYDGFGNLTDQNVTGGSAPAYHVVVDPATNRVGTTDANGNTTAYIFDVENRMVSDPFQNWRYSYAPGNKRVWRGVWTSGALTTDEVTFWSVTGQKLATYQLTVNGTQLQATPTGTNYYLGGKLVQKAAGYVAADRLGSVGRFYPYGQEKPSATTNGTEKFATYFRDAETGLDYAQNRYHNPGTGRFMTPDPYMASGGPANPASWNRYAYVGGDPVNLFDPYGLATCPAGSYNTCVDVFGANSVMAGGDGGGGRSGNGGAGHSSGPYSDSDLINHAAGGSGGHAPRPSDFAPELCTLAEIIDRTCGGGGNSLAAGRFLGRLGQAGMAWWAVAKIIGDAGEKIVGDILGLAKNTKLLDGTSVIPDFWNRAGQIIYEVKNVSSLSYTEQLRDMASWAYNQGYTFELWVREGAELKSAAAEGHRCRANSAAHFCVAIDICKTDIKGTTLSNESYLKSSGGRDCLFVRSEGLTQQTRRSRKPYCLFSGSGRR